MLRTWILFFLPSIMMANLQEPYIENIRSTPTTFTGKPPTYTEYPAAYVEKPVSETSLKLRILKEIPVNKQFTKPATKVDERKRKQQEYYKEIPVYVAKLNFNKNNENKDNFIKDDSKGLHKSLTRVFIEKPIHELVNAEAFLKNNQPKPFYVDLPFPVLDEKPIKRIEKEEALLPNKNNSLKQLNKNLLLLGTTEKLPNEVEKVPSTEKLIDEEEILQTNGLKPFKNLQLPVSDEMPVQKQINEQSFVPHNRPNSFYEYTPLPLTDEPESELINEEEFLQSYKPNPFYEDIPVTVSTKIPEHKRVIEDAFVPNDVPNSVYEFIKANEESFLPNNNPKSFNDLSIPVFTETPVTSQDRDQYFPQFRIITENPIAEQDFFSYDSPVNYFKSKLPVLLEKPVQHYSHARKDSLMKKKLVSLILSTRTDLEKQIQNIRSIHNTFKSGTMYKIGYLISLINKMNRRLSKLYTSVLSNKHNWDSLKMLDTYEKVKSNSELVRDLVKLMRAFLRVKRKSRQELKSKKETSERNSIEPNLGISWSYYDDSLP